MMIGKSLANDIQPQLATTWRFHSVTLRFSEMASMERWLFRSLSGWLRLPRNSSFQLSKTRRNFFACRTPFSGADKNNSPGTMLHHQTSHNYTGKRTSVVASKQNITTCFFSLVRLTKATWKIHLLTASMCERDRVRGVAHVHYAEPLTNHFEFEIKTIIHYRRWGFCLDQRRNKSVLNACHWSNLDWISIDCLILVSSRFLTWNPIRLSCTHLNLRIDFLFAAIDWPKREKKKQNKSFFYQENFHSHSKPSLNA